MKLKGQVAIVTGGGRGIGRAVSLGLAREGANVVVVDLHSDDAEETAREARMWGVEAGAFVANVAKVQEIQGLVDHTVRNFGPVDILVCNAGIATKSPILGISEEDWDRTMDCNLKGMFFCLQKVAEVMVPRKRGRIVNLASTSSFVASWQCMIPYDVSKAGVRMLTAAAAVQLAPYGINVNAIAPGSTRTKLLMDLFEDPVSLQRRAENIPLGRMATPDDLVGAAVFLCSPESAYVTGHTLVVDGGYMLI